MSLKSVVSYRAAELLIDSLRNIDLLLIAALGYATFVLRHGFETPNPVQVALLVLAPIVSSSALRLVGFYRRLHAFSLVHCLRMVLAGEGIAIFILFTLGYITKVTQEYSRLWVLSWALLTPVLLVAERMALAEWLRRKDGAGWMRRRVILIGVEPLLSKLAQRLADQYTEKVELALAVDVEDGTDFEAVWANVDRCCAERLPDDFVLTVPGAKLHLVEAIVPRIRQYWANIDICPEHAFIGLPFQNARHIGGVPVLHLMTRPFEDWQGLVKWLEDWLLTLVFLVIALPVMAIAALAVRLDSPGPVLFRQRRYGFGNREFVVYKFRTMAHQQQDETAPQVRRDDPRVTRVGRFLRRTSLDELPQLFNVLNGSMSLVGPRPHAVAHGRHFAPKIEDYLARHRIKPGITGWAQVNGFRGETPTVEAMEKRVEHDLFYIENWSIWLDISILIRTMLLSFHDDSAF
ncbi:MAG TPA: undecaprenyl-phosphate glucose phosphotransferase [Patescibacteria group bacterium]|nr:undecaprenyl-phosphate glucose phosphotransferase [Patescibacteria group bacterium]